MSNSGNQHETKIIAETKHLKLVERDHWAFVQRTSTSRAVCIIGQTASGDVLLIEQHRVPVGARVIELPAGLVGDLGDQSDESIEQGAARELMEETGYVATHWLRLAQMASCSGLTDEETTLVLATGLKKQGIGGGDESEEITVHEIPLNQINDWLVSAAKNGKLIDPRVYAGLYFLTNSTAGGKI